MQSTKLKELVSEVPETSGVYQFFGASDAVLYVGKAKNLRKRLTNYTIGNRLSARISRMVFLAEKIEFIQTENELEALLLEHNMIKKLAPKYNILLRDDKTFPLIGINKTHSFGQIFKHRGLKDSSSHYFGPFASGGDVNRVIDVLKKSFLLRDCSDSEFKSRKKPCMEYQIRRCSAPCVGLVDEADYQKSVEEAVDFLSGKSSQVQLVLAAKMQKLSDQQNYEKAALIRDRIKSLSSIQAKQNINLSDIKDSDVISLVEKNHQYCVYISFYRGGNNYGSKPYFYSVDDDLLKEEFLAKFLGQFYLSQDPAKNILLNLEIEDHDLMEDFLAGIVGEKVEIKTPKQGDKFNLVKDQERIAAQVLQQRIDQNLNEKQLLLELKNVFQLAAIPDRIEVYDNSHTGGQNAVGALICAGPEGFVKSGYRKYNIRFDDVATIHELREAANRDDTSMLKEVLRRRFKSVQTQDAATSPPFPDFIIIDGGLPQLSATQEVFNELNIKIPFACMSKGPNRNAGEEYFHQTNKELFQLEKNSPLAFYMQRLRDEAHRFAITTHRAKRQKSVTKSGLDEVPNIGAKRKKLLLNHFGSFDKVKEASVEDLMRVDGVSLKVAQAIWKFFR